MRGYQKGGSGGRVEGVDGGLTGLGRTCGPEGLLPSIALKGQREVGHLDGGALAAAGPYEEHGQATEAGR